MTLQPNLHKITPLNITHLLYLETLENICSQFKSPSPLSYFAPILYHIFVIKLIYQRIQPTSSHASRCHHCHCCNVDFVLFHNVTYYTNPLLSHIHAKIAQLLGTTCTLVASCTVSGRLECIMHVTVNTINGAPQNVSKYKGHFTRKANSPWPLHFKHFH